MNKLAIVMAFGAFALVGCTTNTAGHGNSISQGSGNTGIQSGRNASGYGTNNPYSQGTVGNTASAQIPNVPVK